MQTVPIVEIFDLIANPDRIGPEYRFIALFLIVGVGMLFAAFTLLRFTRDRRSETVVRFRRMGWFLLPFSVIWLGFTFCMSVGEVQSARATREHVQSGNYRTLEGCLE
jgi:hypothetical protein